MGTNWWHITESTIPKSTSATGSPVNLGSGSTGSRPASPGSGGGFYNDTTVGKRVYWDAVAGKWRDLHGVES